MSIVSYIVRWFLSHLLLFVSVGCLVYIYGERNGEYKPYLDKTGINGLIAKIEKNLAESEEIPKQQKQKVTLAKEPNATQSNVKQPNNEKPQIPARPDLNKVLGLDKQKSQVKFDSKPKVRPEVKIIEEIEFKQVSPIVLQKSTNDTNTVSESKGMDFTFQQPAPDTEKDIEMPLENKLIAPIEEANLPVVASVQAPANITISAARKQYWDGDYDAALNIYQQLTKIEPNNPDVWGEMGNIFFSQKNLSKMIDAYQQTILLLDAENRKQEAANLLKVVRRANKQRAASIEKILWNRSQKK